MKESVRKRTVVQMIAGSYAILLGMPTVLGIVMKALAVAAQSTSVRTVLVSGLLGVITVVTGVAILAGRNWGRIVFMISVPIQLIYIAAIFPEWLWTEDVPYSVLGGLIYVPLVFFLSRSRILLSLGVSDPRLRNRVTMSFLMCVLIMIIADISIHSSSPPRTGGLYGDIQSLNAYAAMLGAADAVTLTYLGAIIAASIPTRRRRLSEHSS